MSAMDWHGVHMSKGNHLMESPLWADSRLDVCGFTLRGYNGSDMTTCGTQEHGAQVHVVDGSQAPKVGDGLWTRSPGLPVAVRVADCVPILLWDPQANAVAAVHSGWRGTALNIAGQAIREGATLGVRPQRLRAAIGPCIGPCCFEVGDEVVKSLQDGGLTAEQLRVRAGPRGRPHVNLRSANRALLLQAGLLDQNIEDAKIL